jgi:hypothetical protein
VFRIPAEDENTTTGLTTAVPNVGIVTCTCVDDIFTTDGAAAEFTVMVPGVNDAGIVVPDGKVSMIVSLGPLSAVSTLLVVKYTVYAAGEPTVAGETNAPTPVTALPPTAIPL